MSGISLERIAEAADHLMTAPVSNWSILKGIPLRELYLAAREHAAGPLTLAASRLLLDRVRPGDCVLFLSGFVIRDYQRPETDGPVGAAVLARALSVGMGAVPVGVCEPASAAVFEACLACAGLVPGPPADLRVGRHRCAVMPFPLDPAEAEARAEELLDALRPAAVVAVERPAANRRGRYHAGGGFDISAFTAKTDALFTRARAQGIATVGIGDLGNELGMGVVAEQVRKSVANGDRCECPCGGGIAAELPADVAVIANISNWGAHAVAACLAAAFRNEGAFHSGEEERRLIEASVRAGAVDPVGGQLRPYVDGTDAATNAAFVDLLRHLVLLAVRGGGDVEAYRASWHGGTRS